MRHVNYFYKLLFSFLAISIIPLLIIGLLFYGYLTEELKNTLSKQAYNAVTKISESMDNLTSEYGEIIMGLLREDTQIRKALRDNVPGSDEVINKKIMFLAGRKNTGIYVINPQGTMVFPSNISNAKDIKRYFASGILQKAVALKNGYVLLRDGYVNSSGERVAFSIVRSILDARDTTIGYVIIEIYKNNITDICDNLNTNFNMNLIVFNPDFRTIADLRNPKMDGMTRQFNFRKEIKAKQTGFFIRSVNGKQSLVAFHTSDYTQLTVMGILPFEYIIEHSGYIRWITVIACLISLFICLFLAILLTRNMTKPLFRLVACMKRVENGDLNARVDFTRTDELGVLGRSFDQMLVRINDLMGDIVEKQQEIRHSEIKALQAQINPHFLYNTLDSIKWLAKLHGINEISVIATQLGKLLRSSISCEDDIVSVEDTMKSITSYIEIEKIRYSDKFEAAIVIDPAVYTCKIPKLILQPIVENAIIHGIDGKMDGQGRLIIRGYLRENELIFEISDNGVGISPETMQQIDSTIDLKASGNIGVQNVRRRIELYYGREFGLHIESDLGKGTKVILRFPVIREERGKLD